jgi:hypothetical protein
MKTTFSCASYSHMVRNHQDGYPYKNLSLFFIFWKYTETSFFWKNLLVNEFRTAMGGGLLGISKKIISIFTTWQKMVTKFGQFQKLKWPFSSLQFCIFFCCCWKYTESSIFLGKFFGQWIPDRNGRGIARDIKKNYFHFQNLKKMVTMFGQLKKLKWTVSSLQFCILFFLKIYRIVNFFGKMDWLMNSDRDGRGMARDIKRKNQFSKGDKKW